MIDKKKGDLDYARGDVRPESDAAVVTKGAGLDPGVTPAEAQDPAEAERDESELVDAVAIDQIALGPELDAAGNPKPGPGRFAKPGQAVKVSRAFLKAYDGQFVVATQAEYRRLRDKR